MSIVISSIEIQGWKVERQKVKAEAGSQRRKLKGRNSTGPSKARGSINRHRNVEMAFHPRFLFSPTEPHTAKSSCWSQLFRKQDIWRVGGKAEWNHYYSSEGKNFLFSQCSFYYSYSFNERPVKIVLTTQRPTFFSDNSGKIVDLLSFPWGQAKCSPWCGLLPNSLSKFTE